VKQQENMMDPQRNSLLRKVKFIRYLIPLVLFVIVASYEFWEHMLLEGTFEYNFHLTSEVLFFGIFGPSAVFITLSYIARLLTKQIAVSDELGTLNRNLEAIVAVRTEALETRNAELARANVELQKLDQLKSDFVSLVSHELRGPLTTLNGGLEVALQNADQLPPDSRRTLEVMARESHRLTGFVQTILDVSRLEAGKLVLNPGPVAIFPLLRRTVELVCNCGDHEVKWDIPDDLPPVWADEIYLEKIVGNLLNNAVKYSPADSPIELSVGMENGDLYITVSNHGEGIPLELQAQIFERFNRLEHGDRISTKGWGLGLYFAKELTEAQGGKITVKSPVFDNTESPGTAFTVTMPVTDEVPEDA
jgi:signal transduction histidine kinase